MFVYKPDNCKVPIKIWSNENQVEQGALEQMEHSAQLPFAFHHVAGMPDIHEGYGAPIGGVMASEGYIVPHFIGVDIGCLDKDTEFLTPSGWKKISEYQQGDRVLQYNKETDKANFVNPINYIVENCEEFIHFKNSKGLDQMLSDEHKVLVWKGYKAKGYKLEDLKAEDLANLGKRLDKGYYGIKTSFVIENNSIKMTDDEIRLDIMIAADGCIKHDRGNEHQIYLHLRKSRKIERAKELLEANRIEYKETPGKDKSMHIYFFVDKNYNKNLSKYWSASEHQLKVLSEECLLWDGHSGYRSYFSSTDKENADIIQFAFTATNIRAGISTVEYEENDWKKSYIVTPTKNNIIAVTNTASRVKSVDGKKYCFTVPTGYFIARREGKIFITGNCGMCFLETNIPVSLLQTKMLGMHVNTPTETTLAQAIVGNIMRNVPTGFSHHKDKKPCAALDLAVANPEIFKIPELVPELDAGYYQVGTLGGGNHFQEIQEDENGNLCIMLHSGSRNFGYKICNYFNTIAKDLNAKWQSSVDPKWDLAFLPADSDEGKAYISWMNLALDFAMENRQAMMEQVKSVVLNMVKKYTDFGNIILGEQINAHHNYAALEHHFGKNVWVHRKGAIRARAGERGIIPGAMGANSYIVEGLGNPDSFCSASHGAGRKMGRKEASRIFDTQTVIEDMKRKGIFIGKSNMEDITEECTDAYKDIDAVIANEADLVRPIKRLKTVCVIKG